MKGGLVKRSLWVAGPLVACLLLAMFASLATASNRLSTTTTITCPHRVTYTGLAQTPCTASVTGPGLNQTLTVRYSRDNVDAGVVFAKARFWGNSTYRPSEASTWFKITKAASTTMVFCKTATYTGTPVTPCWAKITGVGGLKEFSRPEPTNTVNPFSPTTVDNSMYPGDRRPIGWWKFRHNVNAGTLTAWASFGYAGDQNHFGSTDWTKFTILKAPTTTTVTCPTLKMSPTFTGLPLTPCTVEVTGAGGLDLTTLTPRYKHNVNAGWKTASASYTFKGDKNHLGSSDLTWFSIVKASSTTTVTCPTTPTYSGLPLKPCSVLVTGAGGLSLTPTPTYKSNINAGTMTASASYSYKGDPNHTGSSDSVKFSILRASSTTMISCTTPTYTGHPLTPCTAKVTGANLVVNVPSSALTFGGDTTNAGTTTATASYTYPGDTNHLTSLPVTVSFTINKADQTPLSITDPGTVLSGTAGVQLATTGGNSLNSVTWLKLTTGTTATNCAVSGTGLLADTGGGDAGKTCVVQATEPGNSNYNDAVTKRTITFS